ncbi:MAG: hypothetical protein ACTSRZ_05125 [Promethearchaeota archaeon]
MQKIPKFSDIPIVILASGKGDRFQFDKLQQNPIFIKFLKNRNLSDNINFQNIQNKIFLPINEFYTLLDHLIFHFIKLGIKNIIIIAGHEYQNIFNYIKNFKKIIKQYQNLPYFQYLFNHQDSFNIYGIKANKDYIKGPLYSLLTLKRIFNEAQLKKSKYIALDDFNKYNGESGREHSDDEFSLWEKNEAEMTTLTQDFISFNNEKSINLSNLISNLYTIIPSDTYFQYFLLSSISQIFNYQISMLFEANIYKYCYLFALDKSNPFKPTVFDLEKSNINVNTIHASSNNTSNSKNLKKIDWMNELFKNSNIHYDSKIWYQNKHLKKIVSIGTEPYRVLENYRSYIIIPMIIISIPFLMYCEKFSQLNFNKIVDILNIYNKMTKFVKCFHIPLIYKKIPFLDIDKYKDFELYYNLFKNKN